MKNPYAVSTTQTKQIRISKDLLQILKRIQIQEQKKANVRFGKNKFNIKLSYASKILGRDLK